MIERSDIIWLGVSAGVTGCLIGGMMLGSANVGWLLLLPAGPMGGLPGWLLARKLARQLKA
jgi:hypothetical protein